MTLLPWARRTFSPRVRYTLLRWTLVQLRRAADRWAINFENAAESSRKDVRLRVISTDPIPEADLQRASEYVRERGWVE